MGAFALKKKERKNLKNNPTNHNPNPSMPSPPTLWSFFAPFACLLFFHQHGLPRENKTPVALHAHPAHRCPVTNQVALTAAGSGAGRAGRGGIAKSTSVWRVRMGTGAGRECQKGAGVRGPDLSTFLSQRAGCILGWLPKLGTAGEYQACGALHSRAPNSAQVPLSNGEGDPKIGHWAQFALEREFWSF